MTTNTIQQSQTVSRTDWLTARNQLLAQEKELTRARDRLSAQRRELPWVKVDKTYTFDTPAGKRTLAGLFEGRSQLIIYHFMWRKDLNDACVGCSFLADHIDSANQHLAQHDVTLTVVSRAPLPVLQSFKQRMGWRFNWVSSEGNDFNYDYHVSFHPEELAAGPVDYNYRPIQSSMEELPGISVFFKDERGDVFHTYSSYARGNEEVLGAYMYLDLTPKGRNENAGMGDWVRHHDRYGLAGYVDATGGFIVSEESKCCSHSADPAVAELRAFIENRAQAVRAKDAVTAAGCVSSGVLLFDVIDPLEYRGSDALLQRTKEWFSSLQGPIGFEMRELTVNASQNIGFSHSLNQVSATKTDGAKLEMWWRSTTCYSKVDGKWTIMHEHNSVPFNPETGKASLDLEP